MEGYSRRTVILTGLRLMAGSMLNLPVIKAVTNTIMAPLSKLSSAVNWSAHWIWASSSSPNTWIAFRKTVTLSSVPSSLLADIATDTKYWLFINGTLVTFEGGLKRGPNPNDTYYDEKDIASYLQAGSNTIAILVWYFGKSGFSHKDSGKGGLLFQSSIANSDNTWKVIQHPGYGQDTGSAQPNYRLAESNIYYDARNASALQNWQATSYSDSFWSSATDLGASGSTPWNNLAQRPIPFFRYTTLQNYTNASSLPTQGNGSTAISATLPSNIQVTPYLKVNASAGAVITIQTDHYTDGGENNVRATYVTTSGVQEFESLGWMSGTAVQYTIPSSVQILSLQYRESGYDTSFVGSFTCNDTFLNTLWQKSVRTVYLNMRDNFMDCPTRERAQWWGDVVNDQLIAAYVFDTNVNELTKKAINELIAWQRSDGTLYSPVPSGNWNSELPVQMLASIWSFSNYYLYTGDSSISSAYNAVKTYMKLWTFDSQGLVNHRSGDWDWEDWGSNIDSRVLDNAWYYLALQSTITLARLSNNTADIAGWLTSANSIATHFDAVLWNSTNQEYRSPAYTGDTDDRANALAVVAGLAQPIHYASIIKVLQSHYNCSPWMELYVQQALYRMDAPLVAAARMKQRYTVEVNDPGYTVWELWTKGGSGTDNHGWAAGSAYNLSAYATGVRPLLPGYSSYIVQPRLGYLTSINTTVPTVKGNITVTINRQSSTQLSMNVVAPTGTSGLIAVPLNGMTAVGITANTTVVYQNGSASGSITGLSYSHSDISFVYFTAQPGTWNFTVTGQAANAYEAEASGNTFSGTVAATSSSNCSGGQRVGWIGNGTANTLQFNNVSVPTTGPYTLVIDYTNGDTATRSATLSINGGTTSTIGGFVPTIDVNTVNSVTTTVQLNAGTNTLLFGNSSAYSPDFDRIVLTPGSANLASAHTVTSNNSLENSDWSVTHLTDNVEISLSGAKGYTSNTYAQADISSTPIWIAVDLDSTQSIDEIKLFPRTDTIATDGGTPDFPVNFTIQTSSDGTNYTTIQTIIEQANPLGNVQSYSFPTTTTRYLRLMVTKLGTPAYDEGTANYYRLQLAELEVYNA